MAGAVAFRSEQGSQQGEYRVRVMRSVLGGSSTAAISEEMVGEGKKQECIYTSIWRSTIIITSEPENTYVPLLDPHT
jgi:hypothetical protein